MQFVRYHDPAELRAVAGEWLTLDEAMNNIFFGVLADAENGRYDGDNFWGAVFEGDDLAGVAIRTPPFPAAIAHGTAPQALVLMLDEIWDTYPEPVEMMTTPGLAQVVSRHGVIFGRPPLAKVSGQGVYRLTEVRPPAGVPGTMRPAIRRDLDLVIEWAAGFYEAMRENHPVGREQAARGAARMLDAGELYLWDVDGRPVSMAAARGPTPHGIRISYVYTPRPLRQNGYASALVAALSQAQLTGGRDFCFLFTDLANPTSNHIYQEVGYEFVGEMNIYSAR